MMKLQSFEAAIITTHLARATFVADCCMAYLLSSSLHCFDQVLPTFPVCALFCHCKDHASFTAGCSAIELLRSKAVSQIELQDTITRLNLSTSFALAAPTFALSSRVQFAICMPRSFQCPSRQSRTTSSKRVRL